MRIHIYPHEVEPLLDALAVAAGSGPGPLRDLADKIRQGKLMLTHPAVMKMRDAAEDIYYEEGDREICIDPDAELSESDEHAFVQAWVYVRYDDAKLTPAERKFLEDRA
jgi:hypothetical protein